eukprot:2367970-Pyramimonas_sp.AAC.1
MKYCRATNGLAQVLRRPPVGAVTSMSPCGVPPTPHPPCGAWRRNRPWFEPKWLQARQRRQCASGCLRRVT